MRIHVKVTTDNQNGTRNPSVLTRSSDVRLATSVADSTSGADLNMAYRVSTTNMTAVTLTTHFQTPPRPLRSSTGINAKIPMAPPSTIKDKSSAVTPMGVRNVKLPPSFIASKAARK